MSLVAPVEDGKLVQTESATSSTSSTTNSGMDKESFLQLLVAQMQYQDPLEPTSNTEYISQYAQFSQVESMQNMSLNMDLQRASSLVGQTVYMQTTNTSGETVYVNGKVDYVTYQSGEAYLYIDETAYKLSDLNTVVDQEYFDAYNLATELLVGLNQLPAVGGIELGDGENIDKLKETYDNMSDYQKTFVAKEKVETLQTYVDKIEELRKLAEANKTEETDDSEGAEEEDDDTTETV